MTEVLRTFFIFSFAVVAFSQYLRTSSHQVVSSLREKVNAFDDTLKNGSDELLKSAQSNEHYNSKKSELFSEKCEIPSDTIWYYVLFFYLSCLLGFAASESFFKVTGVSDWHFISLFYRYQEQAAGAYVLVGLAIVAWVFRAGFRAISPKENARALFVDIENCYRTLIASHK